MQRFFVFVVCCFFVLLYFSRLFSCIFHVLQTSRGNGFLRFFSGFQGASRGCSPGFLGFFTSIDPCFDSFIDPFVNGSHFFNTFWLN